MPTIALQTTFGKNTDQIVSIGDFLNQYLPGVELKDRNGNAIPIISIQTHLKNCLTYLENYLSIKIMKQFISEDKHFSRDDWYNWTYVRTSYPVVCAASLQGIIGTTPQITFPPDWLSVRQTNDNIGYARSLNVVPNFNTYVQTMGIIYQGIYPNAGYLNLKSIPNYWKCKYVTGWDAWNIPNDIMMVYGMLTSISLFSAASYGMSPFFGVANQSLSLDGLSQSVSAVQNSNSLLFGPLIKSYLDQLRGPQGMLETLRSVYGDFVFGVA